MWFKYGNLGLLVAGATFVAYKRKMTVGHCLSKPPYPPKSPCTGPDCPFTRWDETWDKKTYNNPRSERHIMLICTGEYNVSGGSDEERSLTPKGLKQIQALAHRLRIYNFKHIGIWYSPLLRAKQTTNVIIKSLPDQIRAVTKDDSLAEGTPVPPIPKVDNLRDDNVFYQDAARIEEAFRKIFTRPDPNSKEVTLDIYVTHKNVIRYFFCRAMQFPPEGWLRLEIPHGSITRFTVHGNGNTQCVQVGEVGYLPYDYITS